jgi:hypothetical protein
MVVMAVVMVVIEAVTAEAIMAAAFTVAIDKSTIFLSRISDYICDNVWGRRKFFFVNEPIPVVRAF